jgi:DNA-binding protein HU-beta
VNKQELINSIASSANLTKSDATRALDCTLDAITKSLKKGNEVRIAGFGTFAVSRRKATTGRNPRTGAPIKIPATTLPKFRAGKGLRESVNK